MADDQDLQDERALRFLHMISQGDIDRAIMRLSDQGYKYGDDPNIDRVFDEKIAVVQRWMERSLEIGIEDGIVAWVGIKSIDLPWDSVDSWWEDNKNLIVRRLLRYVKKGWWMTALDDVSALRQKAKLDWPQLDIIEDSACRLLQDNADADQIDEDDEDDDEGPIVRRLSQDEITVDRMFRRMRDGSFSALRDCVDELEDLHHGEDKDVREALEPHAYDIAKWLKAKLGTGQYRSSVVAQFFRLLEIGARWPELKDLANASKRELMANMVNRLKGATKNVWEGYDLENLEWHIRHLEDLGVEWPDLAALGGMVAAGLNAYQDSVSEWDAV